MATWNELLVEFEAQPSDQDKLEWLNKKPLESLKRVQAKREGRTTILYASAFLQKPNIAASNLSLTHEELNGFMASMAGLDCSKGITLILHTPGGVINAAETVVGYLRSKCKAIDVVIPAFAMSAGTMIALAADRLIMGRQSQLGPIDPQIPFNNRTISAGAIVEQFDQAKKEILKNPQAAHVWAPVLQAVGPSLLQEAKNGLQYGEKMVAAWLASYMFAGNKNAKALGKKAAKHFNDTKTHKSHGRRIDRDEARKLGINVIDLEDDQELQDAVLTAYHSATIFFEKTLACKTIMSSEGRTWVKNG